MWPGRDGIIIVFAPAAILFWQLVQYGKKWVIVPSLGTAMAAHEFLWRRISGDRLGYTNRNTATYRRREVLAARQAAGQSLDMVLLPDETLAIYWWRMYIICHLKKKW